MSTKPEVVSTRKDIDAARRSLMCAYRLFEHDSRTTKNDATEKYMAGIRDALVALQNYEERLIAWSRFSPHFAAQTGYRRDEYDNLISRLAEENELRQQTPLIIRNPASRELDDLIYPLTKPDYEP